MQIEINNKIKKRRENERKEKQKLLQTMYMYKEISKVFNVVFATATVSCFRCCLLFLLLLF